MDEKSKYDAAIESVKQWNSKMMMERKMRQPYLDNTTGLAQTNCHLWLSELDRRPGVKPGQVYSYPARKWRKKKRLAVPPSLQVDPAVIPSMAAVNAEELVVAATIDPVVNLGKSDNSKDKWCFRSRRDVRYNVAPQYEEIDDFEDFEDDFEADGDDSDFEDSSSKRKKSKKKDPGSSSRSSSRRSGRNDEMEKPFLCDLCPMRYKTKSGLDQHAVTHRPIHSHPFVKEDLPVMTHHERPSLVAVLDGGSSTVEPAAGPKDKVPNDYCDFCLGDASMNKKSKVPEDMVSCADCGRSGHPSCLQFTDNMKISVRKYPWQCIECKSCGLCGTSENDDQLLFCDDCDRGYHMYCLNPPLSEPPEGNWSCHLCIVEFHSGVKPNWMG